MMRGESPAEQDATPITVQGAKGCPKFFRWGWLVLLPVPETGFDLPAGADGEFLEDAGHVVVHRTLGDEESFCDAAVGQPPRDERRHLPFAAGEG